MSKDRIKLDNPPSTVVLSDDILNEIYSDMQADRQLCLSSPVFMMNRFNFNVIS